MKKNILNTAAILLILAGGFVSCRKEKETSNENHGVIPSSIEELADIFELKYGEEKEWRYNDWTVKFTVMDVTDGLIDCSTVYVQPEHQEEFYKRTRMFAYLHVETDNQSEQLKVSSQKCWVGYYKNDGLDIQDVWDMLETWAIKEIRPSYFEEEFFWKFGTGSKFETVPFSIYMAKADPVAFESDYNVVKSQYKFVFIITKN
jgi:hypothetical protein